MFHSNSLYTTSIVPNAQTQQGIEDNASKSFDKTSTRDERDIVQAGDYTIQLDPLNDSRYYMATKMIANAITSSTARCMEVSARHAPLCSSM